jgi:GWxTD domain-containing protein
MRSIRLLAVLLSIGIITPVFAANPDFKDWERSPQGYFMTKAEHQEWSAIKTQEDAQKFIDQFLAKRGPTFAADVAARAAKADQYFTIGKTPGSKTLRGKVVILFGPPTSADTADITNTSSVHTDSPAMAAAYSGGSAGTSNTGSDPGGTGEMNEGARTMGGASITRNYHFVYASTPGGPLDVIVSADINTGKDQARDRKTAKQLDAAFEAAAQASIKTK